MGSLIGAQFPSSTIKSLSLPLRPLGRERAAVGVDVDPGAMLIRGAAAIAKEAFFLPHLFLREAEIDSLPAASSGFRMADNNNASIPLALVVSAFVSALALGQMQSAPRQHVTAPARSLGLASRPATSPEASLPKRPSAAGAHAEYALPRKLTFLHSTSTRLREDREVQLTRYAAEAEAEANNAADGALLHALETAEKRAAVPVRKYVSPAASGAAGLAAFTEKIEEHPDASTAQRRASASEAPRTFSHWKVLETYTHAF